MAAVPTASADPEPMTKRPPEVDDVPWWHRFLPEVFSQLGIGLVVGRPERAVVVNDAFCALTGYTADEIVALRPFMDIVAPDARGLIADRVRRQVGGSEEPAPCEIEILHRDGSHIPVELRTQVAVSHGETEMVATFRDLTDQKRIEADLASGARQQEAVAELGRQALVNRD